MNLGFFFLSPSTAGLCFRGGYGGYGGKSYEGGGYQQGGFQGYGKSYEGGNMPMMPAMMQAMPMMMARMPMAASSGKSTESEMSSPFAQPSAQSPAFNGELFMVKSGGQRFGLSLQCP